MHSFVYLYHYGLRIFIFYIRLQPDITLWTFLIFPQCWHWELFQLIAASFWICPQHCGPGFCSSLGVLCSLWLSLAVGFHGCSVPCVDFCCPAGSLGNFVPSHWSRWVFLVPWPQVQPTGAQQVLSPSRPSIHSHGHVGTFGSLCHLNRGLS